LAPIRREDRSILKAGVGKTARSASDFRGPFAALAAALTIGAFIGGAEPTCGRGANAEDIQIAAALQGDSAFQAAFAEYFNLQKKHWSGGWGWGESSPSYAFSKMMHAGFLLRTGVDTLGLPGIAGHGSQQVVGYNHLVGRQTSNPPRNGAGRPWHSSSDYATWAAGSIHGFRYQPRNETTKDGRGVYGHAIMGWRARDRVEMWCPSLNLASDPGHRAGTMLHEATHIQYGDWKGVWRHDAGGKDYWYPHTLSAIDLGELDRARGRGLKHSAFQIEVEFLADLSEFPAPWVPLLVSRAARATGNQLIRTRFSNTVPFTIGVPRR
jgi:hypothetical protein